MHPIHTAVAGDLNTGEAIREIEKLVVVVDLCGTSSMHSVI